MLTILISNSSYSDEKWQSLILKSCADISFKPLQEISLKKDQIFTLDSNDSLCGLELLLQNNGLKVFLPSLPSRKDYRLFSIILEKANKESCTFSDEDLLKKHNDKDGFNSNFDEIWHREVNEEVITVKRNDRGIELKKAIDLNLSANDQESHLIKQIKKIVDAKEPEVFSVDDKESAIWDGSTTWISEKIDQVLFSQSYFKGKLCGEIASKDLSEILSDKIIDSGHGYVLPEARKLSGEDIKNLNEVLNHYEYKEKKQKLEKLTIEAGKLEEISYSMSRALFEAVKLSKITDKYIKDGISKAQLEVAALAVSSMLEIAAVSKGASLDDMQRKLKDKCSLSPEAAYAVASGFVNAAKEAKPGQTKVNWLKLGILTFAIGTIIWFFFFK